MLKTDNTTTKRYVNYGTGIFHELSLLGRGLKEDQLRLNMELLAVHIEGKTNVIPDAISRLRMTGGGDLHPHQQV